MARKRRTRVGRGVACPNAKWPRHGQIDAGNITGNGHYRTRTGRRRRYDCEACHPTFCLNTDTPYFGLHASRAAFDMVANLAVEGVGTAAIGRVTGRAWNTSHRSPRTLVQRQRIADGRVLGDDTARGRSAVVGGRDRAQRRDVAAAGLVRFDVQRRG